MSENLGFKGEVVARSVLRCGLPPPPVGPEDHSGWYHQAEQLPPTRVTGWFGATLGSAASDDDIQLFFFNQNHLDPEMKLVINRSDLVALYVALGRLIKDRGLAC